MRAYFTKLLLSFALLSFTIPANAAEIGKELKIGVGIGGGTLTSGLSGKYYIGKIFGKNSAVQAVVGANGWGFGLGADFVMDAGMVFDDASGKVLWGFGGGASMIQYNVLGEQLNYIGVNGLIQGAYHVKDFPIEIVLDYRPTFFLGNAGGISGLYLFGGAGAVRYYF